MAHRLACEAADIITAAASVSGPLEVSCDNPKREVPMLHFHGN